MEFNKRIIKDRRKQSTPFFSRYTFWGRRKTFRREGDQQRGGYIDLYSSGLLSLLILILGLNILDSFFTLMILDLGGWELNPVVGSAIDLYGDSFWIWKYGIVSIPLILLCLHSQFKRVKTIILSISAISIIIVLYQISLMIYL
jgi:hypothetical protein